MNLTNIFNAFMIWLLRSPLHKIASKNTLLITFPGHKSGKKYTTPVNYVIDSNVIFITSLRSRTWWKNLGGDAKINVHLQGKDLETNGEVFEDNETVKEQLMRYLQKAPQYARYLKVNLDPEGHPNPENVAQAAKERVMILLRSG
ncbi:MAG: nitroreductase family deazaflavin-dependent oxidoreductase [Euryarchaeota archaeon]|nr:nitroreductase family deazaflavin-dependent oxidoreductase [Euryarchaeota archaeon]MBU4139529.1 nitroreductase family deazaflavin-dependent oxidoreductase [Euryarchaeota archaeon]